MKLHYPRYSRSKTILNTLNFADYKKSSSNTKNIIRKIDTLFYSYNDTLFYSYFI